MFNQLTGLGLGLVVFSLIIGVGTVVLQQFNSSMGCPTGYATYNTSTGACIDLTCSAVSGGYTYVNTSYGWCMGENLTGSTYNSSNTSAFSTSATTASGASVYYMQGKLGESSGGLASWTPAVIALAVGLLFIGALMIKKGRQY